MDRLAKKIAENCNSINPPADMETALSELERIYNYKIRQENQLYFVTEWKKQKIINRRLQMTQKEMVLDYIRKHGSITT